LINSTATMIGIDESSTRHLICNYQTLALMPNLALVNYIICRYRLCYTRSSYIKNGGVNSVNYLKNMSIGVKLLIFTVITVLIAITVIVSTALFQFNSFNNIVSEEQAIKGMQGLNSSIEDYKEQSLKHAKMLSLNSEVINAVEEKDYNSIYNIVSFLSEEAKIDFITVTDTSGIILAHTHDSNKKGVSIADLASIQMALKGNAFSDVESNEIVKLSARAAAPIKNQAGIIIGTISTGYMLDSVEIIDKLKQIYNTDLTLFLGDVRFNTTIVQNGSRLVGTKLDSEIANIVLNKKEKYTGSAEILGIPYICSYMPLINSDNRAIGVVFAGQPISDVIAVRNRIINTLLVIAIIAILILSTFIYLYINRNVSRPLFEVVSAAEKIADGNLDVSIDFKSNDEIGTLCKSFNKMTQNLNDVLNNINIAAKQVAAGSTQLSSSSISLSQGATEQASSIEQLTATLEEISIQTKQNAKSANDANELAESTKSNAMTGNEQMNEMLNSMEEINKSSNNISKIIKVIDEIAFQTNILALNAAVEAARAGQHGKGFAVVAEEVRNLAMRSANAAKETTEMIENSIKNVEDGTKIANKTAEALDSIVESISKVANLVNDIAVASNEQATGIAQVNQAINQVSQIVQTNSASSQESASASEELMSQAEMLKEQVSKFVLTKNKSSSDEYLKSIDPEILKTLDSMPEKKKPDSISVPNIELTDKEFGKY
jgi:methyl-accepting chemotaxis protein